MKILISEEEIRRQVEELGRRITADYRGRPLTVLGVLKGSIVLLSDLMRQIAVPHRVALVRASSYRGCAMVSGKLHVDRDDLPELAGRDVLLLDDIFDTGQTLSRLLELVEEQRPLSLRSAVLLWKEGRQTVSIQPDYHCFKIPDRFVVGYGLDYDDDYRHLPYIAVFDEQELEPRRDA